MKAKFSISDLTVAQTRIQGNEKKYTGMKIIKNLKQNSTFVSDPLK